MAIAVWTSFQQIADANGVPYNGAKIYVYAAGTTTPLSLYSDSGLSVSADNPIVCDANGQHAMRYMATASYKTSVTTSAGSPLTGWSKDNIDPGVAVGSGALPVASGGTGATTAATARTNLAAASQSDMTSAQSDIASLQTWTGYNLTTKSRLASGTTAQQPSAGTAGSIRWDTDYDQPVVDDGSAWKKVAIVGKWDTSYASSGAGLFCLQRSRTEITSTQTISSVIPYDGTTPQITEGAEITGSSISFTPTNASSVIRYRAIVSIGQASTLAGHTVALFKDGAASAVRAALWKTQDNSVLDNQLIVEYEVTPGSVSAITFVLRGGSDPSTSLYINTDANSSTLGGTRLTSITIEEWITK